MHRKLTFAIAGLIALLSVSETMAKPRFADRAAIENSKRLLAFLDYARERNRGLHEQHLLGGMPAEGPLQVDDPEVPPTGAVQSTPWGPYLGAFEIDEAAHLLHRTVIGPRWGEMQNAADLGMRESVEQLLLGRDLPLPPAPWALEPFPDTEGWSDAQIDSLFDEYWQRRDPLRLWWAEQMVEHESGANITEMMTLFWHDHFATGFSGVQLPQSMFVQNQLLREHATGNFKDLVKAIAIDPAMLIWLDGVRNRKDHINENFARELCELFTIGIGNYSQDDVEAAARAFTGWTTPDGLVAVFDPEEHDSGEKTFLGRTGNWDGDDIIDILFEREETAQFICRKLARWFLDENTEEWMVRGYAKTLRLNNWDIQPVLKRMLTSAYFYEPTYRGSIITDGVDRSLGSLRSLHVAGIDLSDPSTGPAQWVLFSMDQFNQRLLEPPDVSGWTGYRAWLNATTLPWRKTLDMALLTGEVNWCGLDMQADVIELANQFSDPNDAELLIDELSLYLFSLPPTELVRQALLDELLQGAEPWEWNLNDPEAESRLRGTIGLAVRLPDYQTK